MRLILIRHGQAEASSADGSDFRRALTPAGRERLENAYPSLARYLNAKATRAPDRRSALPLHAPCFTRNPAFPGRW